MQMPYQMQITSQVDLFPSESTTLPEWNCPKWQCMNRSVEVLTYDDYSLPSIQYSIPRNIKLTALTISLNMLKDEYYVRWIFCYIHKLYNSVNAGGGEQVLCDLHQCLSYVTVVAQNMCTNGALMSVAVIVRSMERLLISVGTLKDFACSNDSLSTGVIEMNYRFHAILMLWTSALHLFYMAKDLPIGLELFYPSLTTEDSALSQGSTLLAYGCIVVARITHIPFVCRCLKIAWEQLCYSLNGKLFSVFEHLLALCNGTFQCPSLENATSVMLLDLYVARGTVDANVFLNVFCALDLKRLYLFRDGQKSMNGIMCCLDKIIVRIPENKIILSKVSVFIERLNDKDLDGVDVILQTLFNRLAQLLTGTYSKSLHYIPESGKHWLDYILAVIGSNNINSDDEWSLLMHLLGKVLPPGSKNSGSESTWKSLKSRVFAKFTWKRLRELALPNFVQLISVFISLAISADVEEASEKILQLFSNIIDGSEKERVCVIMRGIHALLELFYHRNLDSSRIINALVIFMDKLSDSDHTDFYLESYLYVCDKGVCINKLAKFLSSMNDMDVCRLLEKTADVDNVDDSVWDVALRKLDSSFALQTVTFLSHQLRRACIKNRQCAIIMLKSAVKAILSERIATLQNCFNFLKIFFENAQLQIDFAVEFIFPVWFLLVMLKMDSEEMLHISHCMYDAFCGWFHKLGVTEIGMSVDNTSTTILCKKVLQKFGTMPAEYTGTLRVLINSCLDSVLPIVTNSLARADQTVIENTIFIVSYLFKYCGWLIFKPPSECSFNRSNFVKMCKVFLQNILINREFQEDFLAICLSNFFSSLLHLPVTSTQYIQRLLFEMIFKFGSVPSLKQIMLGHLRDHPDIVLTLKKGQFNASILNNFFSLL